MNIIKAAQSLTFTVELAARFSRPVSTKYSMLINAASDQLEVAPVDSDCGPDLGTELEFETFGDRFRVYPTRIQEQVLKRSIGTRFSLIMLAVLALGSGRLEARLGFTKAQCDEYYKVAGEQYSWGPGLNWFEYKIGIFLINIAFLDDRAVAMTYANQTGSLSEEMVSVLLDTGNISRAELKEDFTLEKTRPSVGHAKATFWTSAKYPGVIVFLSAAKPGYDLVSVTTEESRAATEAAFKGTAGKNIQGSASPLAGKTP